MLKILYKSQTVAWQTRQPSSLISPAPHQRPQLTSPNLTFTSSILDYTIKMRSSTVVALFATSAVAQSSAEMKTGSAAHILNPLGLQVSTVTMLGSSSGTTTYVNSCSITGIPASFLSQATAGKLSFLRTCLALV